jgi:hypothetical protein
VCDTTSGIRALATLGEQVPVSWLIRRASTAPPLLRSRGDTTQPVKTVLARVLSDTRRVSSERQQVLSDGIHAAFDNSSEECAARRRTARLQRTRTVAGLVRWRSAASDPLSSCT